MSFSKDDKSETTEEGKRSRNLSVYLLFGCGILMLYALSFGPVQLIKSKGMYSPATKKFINHLYSPLAWAYNNSVLHKPLGMYLHVWCPDIYDRNGESFVIIGPTGYDTIAR